MGVMYRPAAPTPPGYRTYQDVVREIEVSEDLKSTGFHYAEEPSAEEIAYKSRTFFGNEPLFARLIVSDDRPGWVLLWKARTITLPVNTPPPGGDWEIETGNTAFNKWARRA